MLLKAVVIFIFILFLSKEYVYINEEFFVVVCFLFFGLGFVTYIADFIRNTLDAAISEVRRELSEGVMAYSVLMEEEYDLSTKALDSLDLAFPVIGSLGIFFIWSRQPLQKVPALVNGFLAHTALAPDQEEPIEALSGSLRVDSVFYIGRGQSLRCPVLPFESCPNVNVLGNFVDSRDATLLLFTNFLVIRALS
jgi:hypothetical protein